MKTLALSCFLICFSIVSSANAQRLNTDENDLVCQLNDYVGTKIFVNIGYNRDGEIGKRSTKVLEMATKNTYANNNRLHRVKLLSVARARCIGCESVQVILYKSEGDDETIVKLETTDTTVVVTRGVDRKGYPLRGSVVEKGHCEPNEVY